MPTFQQVLIPWTDSRLTGVTESDILKVVRKKNSDGSLRVNLGNNNIVTMSPGSFVDVRIDMENFDGRTQKIVNIIARDSETKSLYRTKIPMNSLLDVLKEDHSTLRLPTGDGISLPQDASPAYGYTPWNISDLGKLAAYTGLALSVGQVINYDQFLQIWLGKNGKFYGTHWSGNQWTGGREIYANARSNRIGWFGKGMFGISTVLTLVQIGRTDISVGWGLAEIGSSAIETFSTPSIGIAWFVGWDLLGRNIASLDAYQRFKFNLWYDYWESLVGPPSDSNKEVWNYFYENYQF